MSTLQEQRERQLKHDAERDAHARRRDEFLRPLRSRDELKALADEGAAKFADADADEVLAWVAQEFGYRTAVACSMSTNTKAAAPTSVGTANRSRVTM